MQQELERIRAVFERARWTRIEVEGSEALQLAFGTSYAIVGFLVAQGVEQVLATWEHAQDALRNLKSATPNNRDNDAYLVIILPRVDVETERLQAVLDNTYVCRKICVEVDGRTIEEALRELPFFAVPGTSGNSTIQTEIGELGRGLPELLLRDLRKSSADVLLEALLQGKYDQGAK